MTREEMKSMFVIHTNGEDEWIKIPKRTYHKMIDIFCDEHEAKIKKACKILEDANIVEIKRHIKEISTKDAVIKQRIEMLQGANKALDELFKECKLKDQRIAELEEDVNLFSKYLKEEKNKSCSMCSFLLEDGNTTDVWIECRCEKSLMYQNAISEDESLTFSCNHFNQKEL